MPPYWRTCGDDQDRGSFVWTVGPHSFILPFGLHAFFDFSSYPFGISGLDPSLWNGVQGVYPRVYRPSGYPFLSSCARGRASMGSSPPSLRISELCPFRIPKPRGLGGRLSSPGLSFLLCRQAGSCSSSQSRGDSAGTGAAAGRTVLILSLSFPFGERSRVFRYSII